MSIVRRRRKSEEEEGVREGEGRRKGEGRREGERKWKDTEMSSEREKERERERTFSFDWNAQPSNSLGWIFKNASYESVVSVPAILTAS